MERVLLDTSAFNVIEGLQGSEKERVLKILLSGISEVRVTWEVIQEVVSVAGTGKEHRLRDRCHLLHALARLPPFQPFPAVVRSELSGKPVFLLADDHENLRAILGKLADGHSPGRALRELHVRCREEKKVHSDIYRKIQEETRNRRRSRPSLQRTLTFDDFNELRWKRLGKRIDSLIDNAQSSAPLSAAIDQPSQYPYSHAFLRTEAALLYRHLVQDRRVDQGDVIDAASLICLAGTDKLITEDRGIREMGNLVWRNSKDILALREWSVS